MVFKPKSQNLFSKSGSTSIHQFFHRHGRGNAAYNTLKKYQIPQEIIIQEVKKAIDEAQKDILDLALWSNKSKAESGIGAVVVWKNTPTYECNICKIFLRKNKEIFNIKL